MNHDPSMSSWQGQMPDEDMVSHNRPDEFTDLLDFDFDFTTLDNVVSQAGHSMPTSTAQIQTTMMQDVQLTSMDPIQSTQPSPYAQMQSIDVQGNSGAANTHVQSQFYAPKQPQQQSMVRHNYGQGQTFIPPTPNSMEMHGRARNHSMRVDTERRIYEPYTRCTDDQSAFTPLISPAMTPLEQQYRLPEYTIPGEYFTPLTSPALEGRNPNNNFLFNNPSHIDMNFVSSPMEFPAHMPTSTAPPSPGTVRKSRRKMSFQARTGTRLLRQSPSVRPLGSRQRPQGATGSQSEDTPHSQAITPANRSALYLHSSSNESSCQNSVSPEPLTEPLMPPPALPRANGRSPHLPAQESQQAQEQKQDTPSTQAPSQSATPAVTPATLMRLQNQQHRDPSQAPFSRSGSVIVNDATDEVMEDISLPEPASGPVQSTPNERTPSITPKPTPAPNYARPGTASTGPSPQIGAMPSPAGPVGLKRSDSKQPNARTAKKRQSTHSAQISPALRPKMSPSLKPLLKGSDSMSAETSALYLASKSNYQHILEGTVLPGVSYPESLAENLSSKRTNHKLAEQGRRNRINTALKEIEGLLPSWLAQGSTKDKDKDRKDGGESSTNGSSKSPDKPASSQPISKASTVEMAIVYIKSLQQQLAQTQEKLKIAESKLGEKSNPQSSSPNIDTNPPSESNKPITNQKPGAADSTETAKSEVANPVESDQLAAK